MRGPVLPNALCRGTTAGARCEKCPLAKEGRPNRPVVAEGPTDPDWIILGEGPGQTEVALGRPFTGASGGLVDKALTAIRCDRRRVHINNSTLCLPPADAGEPVRMLARRCCEPRLLTELARLPSKPVLALGAVAMQAMLGSGFSIMEISGSYHEVDPDGTGLRVVIPTLHPAAILRGGSGVGGAHSPDLAFWNFVYDAAKVHAIAQGRDIVFHEDGYTEYEDPQRAEELIRAIVKEARRERMVAVDTETYVDDEKRHSALQPRNAKMSAIGLATPNWGICVAWGVVTRRGKRLIGALMADPTVRTVMHNRLYDRPVLRRHGLPVFGPCGDTLLKHHNAFPGLAHDLQRVATQYFAIAPWKAEFRHGKDTVENLTTYCMRDTLVTARLDSPLTTAMQHTKTEASYEIDLMCAEAAEWMYEAGIPVSREVNQQLHDQFWANMEESRVVIEEKANDPEIRQVLWERLAAEQAKRYRKGSATKPDPENYKERIQVRLEEIKKACNDGKWQWRINSSAHLGALLKIHGLELEETPKGKPKITLGILEEHLDKPIVEALYAYRKDKTNEDAKKVVEAAATAPNIRERLWSGIAAEQAKTIRKSKGTPPDPEDYDERRAVRLREIEEADAKGQWEWRIGSPDHVAAYLRARGVPLYILTEKGSTSTKKEILEGFAHLPEVASLLDYRENQKMFSTFCVRMFDRFDAEGNIASYGHADENDRIHPRWNVHRITGRWSAEDPVCQNWPKADPKKGRPNLRSQVVAPERRILVGFDAAQLEARIIALLSGDAFLCEIFDNDRDIHSEMARVVWPNFDDLPYDQRKVLRDTVKRPEYCVVPGTRILKTDLTWQPIETLRPGDKLIGFTASAPGRPWKENYFRTSTVRSIRKIRQPCYRITTTQGTVTASDEHLWVGRLRNGGERRWSKMHRHRFRTKQWIRTDDLKPGDLLTFTAKPWQEDRSWGAGYLAGIYDGEGWTTKRVGFGQRRGIVEQLVQELLAEGSFDSYAHIDPDGMVRSEIRGGIWGCLAFLGTVRPRRLLGKSSAQLWRGRRLRGRGPVARVTKVEYIGVQDVVAMETTSRTFIAEGFLSHNCAFYGGDAETGWKSVVKDYPDVKLEDIVRMVALMTAKMPGIARWHQQLLQEVAKPPHEIRSAIYGRRRCFPLGNADINEVWNYPVQSTGADIMAYGLRQILPRLRRNYRNADPIIQIHDAIVFECDEGDADRLKEDVRECFTQTHTHNGVTIHFPVDARSGKSWAEV